MGHDVFKVVHIFDEGFISDTMIHIDICLLHSNWSRY